MDRLIFKSVRMLVGGRVRAILSGGAPLSEVLNLTTTSRTSILSLKEKVCQSLER